MANGNVVLRFEGNLPDQYEYFAIKQPDSGLVLPDSRIGTLTSVRIPVLQVSLRRASQTSFGLNFKLIDLDSETSKLLTNDYAYFLFKRVDAWVGRVNENMDFSEYTRLPASIITQTENDESSFSFTGSALDQRLTAPFKNDTATILSTITETSTTLQVSNPEDLVGFPQANGRIRIDNEILSYETITGDTMTGLVRSIHETEAAGHEEGTPIYQVTRLIGNPIDLMLEIMRDLGISDSFIDVAVFNQIRDESFNNRSIDILAYQVEDALKFMQDELLQATATRLILTGTDKITLRLLGQASFDPMTTHRITDATMTKYKKTRVKYNNIVNQVRIEYDYLEARQMYRHVRTFRDDLSIQRFGATTEIIYRFKGIRQTDNGEAFVQELAQRYLDRFSTPNPEIEIDANYSASEIIPGDIVNLASAIIPSQLGVGNFRANLEAIKRGIDPIKGVVNLTLSYTRYTGAGGFEGFISPSPAIESHDTHGVIVDSTDQFEVGFKVRIWDDQNHHNATGHMVYEIESIDDTTRRINFVGGLSLIPGQYRLFFANYDEVTDFQKNWIFIGDDIIGADGTFVYEIS